MLGGQRATCVVSSSVSPPSTSRSRRSGPRRGSPRRPRRERRRAPRAARGRGSRASRRTSRCGGCSAARGTGAAGNRAPRGSRRGRNRPRRLDARRPRTQGHDADVLGGELAGGVVPVERDRRRRHRRPTALLGGHGAVRLLPRTEGRRLAAGVRELAPLRRRPARGRSRRSGGRRPAARRSTGRGPAADPTLGHDASGLDHDAPAPPLAKPPRCTRCHVVGTPSCRSAEYWHMGETQMRLRTVRSRTVIGSNRAWVTRWLLRGRVRPGPAGTSAGRPVSCSGGRPPRSLPRRRRSRPCCRRTPSARA